MSKKELAKLRRALPRGYAKTLAETTGFDPVYVYRVINGDRKNEDIITAAIQLAEENRRKEAERKERIRQL